MPKLEYRVKRLDPPSNEMNRADFLRWLRAGRGRYAFRLGLMLLACSQLGPSCTPSPLPPVEVEPISRAVSFVDDVKPVLDRRCVVCHSCYNAACQLKLSSYEGIERGGSKAPVYNASRIHEQTPTRLFEDAQTVSEWRALGFHDVLSSRASSPANDSILLHMLAAKRLFPTSRGEYRPEAVDLSCPADSIELGAFLARHPERGMPFGFPALSHGEHNVLATWLDRGATGPGSDSLRALKARSPSDATHISRWEAFLNQDDAKHAMTARYLYEHLFLAHLHFPGSRDFYQIVRSTRPPGEPIAPIATRRPYDDPGVSSFYYRLRKIHSTIVHKTHMVAELDDTSLPRVRELFIESEWTETPDRRPYGDGAGSNPFLVYAQIPARARYAFLLDNAEYIIRTFIRGPVCKGQIALNVVNDHFWVMFSDPDSDLGVVHPGFLLEQAENLGLPAEAGSDASLITAIGDGTAARRRSAEYARAKIRLYDQLEPAGQGIEDIWRGRRATDSPFLTVYRHFDSASVHKGALGDLPRTLWVIDFALLERIYYALVAGFDVFGNISHQISTRRYMDYLRMEGELHFVYLLPPETRADVLRSWYIGDGAVEDMQGLDLLTNRPTSVHYTTSDPKRELVERVVTDHLLPATGIAFDDINYQRPGDRLAMPSSFDTHEDVLAGLRALSAPGTAFIRHVTDTEANVLWLRVRDYQGEDRFISIVINRWHDNVNSLFLEKNRLDASKDTMDFHRGPIGSYPNYFLDVAAEDLPEFFDMLANFDGSPEYEAKLARFGVNRADGRFWGVFDWFQAEANRLLGVEAGLYDLNRYYATADPERTAEPPMFPTRPRPARATP